MSKKKKSLGELLLGSLKEALDSPSNGKILAPNVPSIRKKLHMTQLEFAKEYRINVKTLRQWEQGARGQDSASLAYLACISKAPDQIREILNGA
jgi:DNA-binding transcriptional regulator YiaG